MTSFEDEPLLILVTQVRTGQLGIDDAERVAASEAVTSTLSLSWVGPLSEAAFNASKRGQWFESMAVQRLLVAATAQLPDEGTITDAYRMRQIVWSDWVEIAHLALLRMPSPDGRLLQSGRERGEHCLLRAEQAGRTETAGRLHFRLGTLHLDPYVARYSPLTGFAPDISPWTDLPIPELGERILGIGASYAAMPQGRDALQYAQGHFRAALPLATAEARGRTAKALAQTLDVLGTIGEPVDPEEILSACGVALDALDPVRDRDVFEEMSATLARWT